MFSRKYCIAGLVLLLESDEMISSSNEFTEFESFQTPEYIVKFRKVSELPEIGTDPIAEETGFCVFSTNEDLLYRFVGIDHVPYAITSLDWNAKNVLVQYLEKGRENLSHAGGAFFHIRWEEVLLHERRMLLHACCVKTQLGGILFSGVSGVGKSTQGDLWCRYEGAELINGDRPVLYKKGSTWNAYGSPYAGSSKCHVNEYTEVRAIIMLAQAETCSIRRLAGAEAFRRVFAQTTAESWNSKSIEKVCNLTEQLISDIPVYELSCTPDRDAVNLLKKTLLKGVGMDWQSEK